MTEKVETIVNQDVEAQAEERAVKVKKHKGNAFMRNPFAIFVFVILIVYVISFLLPTAWMIISSFKSPDEFRLDTRSLGQMLWLPEKWNFSNYQTCFNLLKITILKKGNGTVQKLQYDFWGMTMNSFIYSIGSTLIHTFTCCCAAYAAARYGQYIVCRMLYPIVIVTMVLPIVGSLGAELTLMRQIGFYDNLFGMLLMKTGFLGQYFLIFYAAFKGLSWGYAEAAFIDGAGHMRVFFTIMLPLMATTFSAVALVTFITNWNAWNVNVIYMPSFPMISYALYNLENGTNKGADLPIKIAATIVVSVPILILFILLRKKLMGSLTLGGLKG